jgi:hypothetical protein
VRDREAGFGIRFREWCDKAGLRTSWFLLILPVLISISFFLIVDIDSPRAGIIRNVPENLLAAQQSMKAE